jgi:DMSO/TMAO reductase YedYZ molybdopterin-dependent catalytic subunit
MSKLKLLIELMIASGIVITAFVSVLFAAFSNAQTSNPPANTDAWKFLVRGLVQNPLNLTFEELKAMPRTTVSAVLYCVDYPNDPIAQGNWTGVKLSLLLEEAQASPDTVKIAFVAKDGYTTDLTMNTAMRQDVIIALELNGESLSEKLRLVLPGKWGYKWISNFSYMELVNYDFKGFWEGKGYSDEADIPASP